MLAEKIIEYVKSEYNGGQLTQQEIADALNVDPPTINRLLSGKRTADGLTIGTFDKMFPRAEIKLTGGTVNAPTINNGTNSGVITGGVHLCDERITRILDALMSSDLPPESKVKAYQIIKDTK